MAGIERYHIAPAPGEIDVRRVAAELARRGAAVEVTTTRQTVRVDPAQRVATVRPLPARREPTAHRPRAGRAAVVAGAMLTGTAATGFTLGALGIGLSAVQAAAAAAGAAGLLLPAAALLARRSCPGAHCGGCR